MKMVIWGAVVFLMISIATIITGKWKEGLLIYAIACVAYGVFLLIYAEVKGGEGVFHGFFKALKRFGRSKKQQS